MFFLWVQMGQKCLTMHCSELYANKSKLEELLSLPGPEMLVSKSCTNSHRYETDLGTPVV